jgi:hypothetical protein
LLHIGSRERGAIRQLAPSSAGWVERSKASGKRGVICWAVTHDDWSATFGAAPLDDRRTADEWLAAVDPVEVDESSNVEDAAATEYVAMGIESARRGFEVEEDGAQAHARSALTHGELVGRAVLRMRLFWGWSQKELELMLHGDPWEHAIIAADRRINRRRSA